MPQDLAPVASSHQKTDHRNTPPSRVPLADWTHLAVVTPGRLDDVCEALAGRCFHDVRPGEGKAAEDGLWFAVAMNPDHEILRDLRTIGITMSPNGKRKPAQP